MKTLYLLLILTLTACSTQERETHFESFLSDLSENLASEKMDLFVNSKMDPEGELISLVYNEIEMSINELHQDNSTSQFLDSLFLPGDPQVTFVTLALHQYANNKPIVVNNLLDQYSLIEINRRDKKRDLFSSSLNMIVQENDSLFIVGDTLSAVFILDFDFGQKHIASNNLVSDSVYYQYEDIVEILFVLESKFFEKRVTGEIDSSDINFSCRVIDISDDNAYWITDKVEPGSMMNISLRSYGRLLRKDSLSE